jgi:hypothetical protein
MEWDIFFAISQTPAGGTCPSEAEMFRNFFQPIAVELKVIAAAGD